MFKKTRCPHLQGSRCLPLKVKALRFLEALETSYAVMLRDTEDRQPQLQRCEKLQTCVMYSLFYLNPIQCNSLTASVFTVVQVL
jgi:hypothetical protein